MRVKALCTFFYARKKRRAGDEFEAPKTDARQLIAVGYAQQILDPMPAVIPVEPPAAASAALESKATAAERPKSRYRRRDMQAQG